MENYIPVLDLFAGPGGLAEGTSTFVAPDGKKLFDITKVSEFIFTRIAVVHR